MASNRFGNLFQITTWGESHGRAIGVVIDGCPAGIALSEAEIDQELARRRPGQSPYTSLRKEKDQAQILSGVFEGLTTGAPISILIWNEDADSSAYEPLKELYRPGHANYTYLHKYGIFDYRGGGRASARETACRVAAGVVARKVIPLISINAQVLHYEELLLAIEKAKEEKDSVGGIVECQITGVPIGLGDPVYEKLEANLAKAMMSLPATKGFEVGSGFASASMRGSEHNDLFTREGLQTNHAGGTLGGISTGEPIIFRVAFKPPSSIARAQPTLSLSGESAVFELPPHSRHDPCVALRAPPIVEAMAALVLADSFLMNQLSRLHPFDERLGIDPLTFRE